MQTTPSPCGKRFVVTPENAADQELIEALDFERAVRVADVYRRPSELSGNSGYVATSATLEVSRTSPAALEAQAGRETLRALRELFRLGLGQPADQVAALAAAANPQPQEQLAASLVELQRVVSALVVQIGQIKLMVKEVAGAHAGAPVRVDAPIVGQEGGAA